MVNDNFSTEKIKLRYGLKYISIKLSQNRTTRKCFSFLLLFFSHSCYKMILRFTNYFFTISNYTINLEYLVSFIEVILNLSARFSSAVIIHIYLNSTLPKYPGIVILYVCVCKKSVLHVTQLRVCLLSQVVAKISR